MKKILMASLAFTVGIAAFAAHAEAPKAGFKTGVLSLDQAKSQKLKNTPGNQLFVCNNTNLPNQGGTAIRISFPQAGVADQTPQPGSCAYLENDNGAFTTQTVIYAPASGNTVVYNSNLSSGQMWGVTYNSANNTYPVAQIQ